MAAELMIQAEGLKKRYGETQALDGVSFSVPAGTILGLLGPNGAGKTTAVRILTTLALPDAGTATVAGIDGDGVFAERVDLMEYLNPGSGIADAVDEALFFWVRRCRQRHVRM